MARIEKGRTVGEDGDPVKDLQAPVGDDPPRVDMSIPKRAGDTITGNPPPQDRSPEDETEEQRLKREAAAEDHQEAEEDYPPPKGQL